MLLREIVFDTETTGREPKAGDRVVELGALELINHVPSGRQFHAYINPERGMPEEVVRVHGLTAAFLADKPKFAEIAEAFLRFIDEDAHGQPNPAQLIAHNARFDQGFLNAEFRRLNLASLPDERFIDTLMLARNKHPGAPNSLDALCKRYEVDASARDVHGALIDSYLLAEVYLHLIGGRQPGLALDDGVAAARLAVAERRGPARPIRPHAPSDEERTAWHALHEGTIKDSLWLKLGA